METSAETEKPESTYPSENSTSETAASPDKLVVLNLVDPNQEILQKITSQDAECQTMLQELIDDLNVDGKEDNACKMTALSQLPVTSTCIDQGLLGDQANAAVSLQQEDASTTLTSGNRDTSNVLHINNQTEVVIDGKKYVLMVNEETGQVSAYPVDDAEPETEAVTGVKKATRGRPKRSTTSISEVEDVEETGTLEGGTGESQTDAAEGLLELYNTGPDGVRRSIRKRKIAKSLEDFEIRCYPNAKVVQKEMKKPKPKPPPQPGVVKKKRGRPRRYPPRGQSSSTHIPAVIIPGPNGQTLMMAPIRGLQNLEAFQEQVKRLPPLMPQPPPTLTPAIQPLKSLLDGAGDNLNHTHGLVPENMLNMEDISAVTSISGAGDLTDNTGFTTSVQNTPQGAATVFQFPNDIVSLMTKQEPVKIGLKATENDLEELRCIKCNYQAYFPRQYQEHIALHPDEVFQCKSCKYLSFDRDQIISHTRSFHPRCICDICDFMADQAYVIKRHMTRHKPEGYSCGVCGKSYKDKYILKMHMKMVHMPADVLFECISCNKKFTRKAHLKRHLRIHEPDKPYKCPQCDYRGSEKADLSKHELVHQEPKYFCEVCGKHFRHAKNKDIHIKRHRGQKDYKCGVCDFFGYTFTDIRKHIERKHSNVQRLDESLEGGWLCSICHVTFVDESQFMEHQSECFPTIEQSFSITTAAGQSSQALLQLPMSVHMGEKILTVEEVPMGQLEGDLEDHGISLTEDQLIQAVQVPGNMLEFDPPDLIRGETIGTSDTETILTTVAQ